jgi:pimeloyl-ACP methyl ester carboxylesterase
MTEKHTTSMDGTRIAFERLGDGPPLVLVCGSLQGRSTYRPLAEAFARHLTVFLYDRRGRGGSGDTPPYAVEREVEDLAAVLAEAALRPGATSAVYGHSSGAALVMHAGARGLAMDRIVLHDPPFGPGGEEDRRVERAEAERLAALLAEDRRAEAVRFFLGSTGMPAEVVEHLGHDPALLANAPTLLYDPYELTSERSRAGLTPAGQAATIGVPTLVIAGGANPDWMIEDSRQIADALPHGRLRVLPGQEHVVPPEVLAPVVVGFVTT